MTETEIIAKVRTLMNESGGEDAGELLTDDTLKLDDYIVSVIPDAVALAQDISADKGSSVINMRACAYGIFPDSGEESSDGGEEKSTDNDVGRKEVVYEDALGRATVYDMLPLPDDYAQLIWLMGEAWNRPCFAAEARGSEQHKAQTNPLTMAGINAPVCVDDVDKDGNRVLLCWPQGKREKSNTDKYYLLYSAKYSSGAGLTGEENTLTGICYIIASLVYRIFENIKTADDLLKVGESLI